MSEGFLIPVLPCKPFYGWRNIDRRLMQRNTFAEPFRPYTEE